MVDVYEILRQKENDIVRVQKEIQALRFVAPMLFEADDPQFLLPEGDSVTLAIENDVTIENPLQDEASPPAEVSLAIPPKRSRLRNLLSLATGLAAGE